MSSAAVFRRVAVLALGAALVATMAPGSGAASRTAPAQQTDCRVGGEPTQPYDEHPPEGSLRYGTRPVVIGCARLASGRRVELAAYQLGTAKQTSLCIDTYFFDTRHSWGCGSNEVHGGAAIDATSTDRYPGRPPVVAGATRIAVRRVVVRSEVKGRLRRHPTTIVTVRDQAVLDKMDVDRPFRRYLAEVPSAARAVTAEAFDARPRTLGIAFAPGFRAAIGQGLACYTRPRITRLRLLDAARLGRQSRLRAVAIYPVGTIGSLDVNVGGRGGAHADLAPTPNGGHGRWIVTLPVGFRHRGRTFIDLTADGVPRSPRCGPRPPLRSSALRTLGVRVR